MIHPPVALSSNHTLRGERLRGPIGFTASALGRGAPLIRTQRRQLRRVMRVVVRVALANEERVGVDAGSAGGAGHR
jgi:hypothetical protein